MTAGSGVLLPHTRSRAMDVPDGPTMMQAQARSLAGERHASWCSGTTRRK